MISSLCRSSRQFTPLHIAAQRRHAEIAERLIDPDAPLEAKDKRHVRGRMAEWMYMHNNIDEKVLLFVSYSNNHWPFLLLCELNLHMWNKSKLFA